MDAFGDESDDGLILPGAGMDPMGNPNNPNLYPMMMGH